MNKQVKQIIKIWSYTQVPRSLKQLCDRQSEWVVLIPAGLDWPEIEDAFLHAYAGNHSVVRANVAGGCVLFLGEREANVDI